MGTVNGEGYTIPPEFDADARELLADITSKDSTELWLIQWPYHQHPEIDGQELSLELRRNGNLGTVKDSNGKEYDMLTCAANEPDATVFLSSVSESKTVGKISRRVSLVHYMGPEDYEKLIADNKRLMYQKSSGTLFANSSQFTPSQSKRKSTSGFGRTVSTHSSRQKSALSGGLEPPKSTRRRHTDESIGSMDKSKGSHSEITISGSSEHSHKMKSRKKAENED
ncbi:hypothetical protein SLE2022_049050 [Rubroshorea leprosula]